MNKPFQVLEKRNESNSLRISDNFEVDNGMEDEEGESSAGNC